MAVREQLIVVGAGGFGREALDVLEALEDAGTELEILGVVDDQPSNDNLVRLANRGVEHLGPLTSWLAGDHTDVRFVLGIGSPAVRRRLAQTLESAGCMPYSAVHPEARVGTCSQFDDGVVICAGAVISTNVRLGRYVHVNPSVTIGHDTVVEDFTSINPGAVLSGEVTIKEGALIGASATVLQQLTVGAGTIVGAAALLTKDAPANVVVKGIPGVWHG